MSNVSNDIATTNRPRAGRTFGLMAVVPGLLIAVLVAGSSSGCSAQAPLVRDVVIAEGLVSVRGAEPFTELVLETTDRNYYVLKFASPEERAAVQDASPAFFRVEGDVYRGEWNGRAFAHLRVESVEPAAAER